MDDQSTNAPVTQAVNGIGSPVSTSPEGTVKPAHRPGWQTTEFWVSVLTIIAMLAGNVQGLPPKYAQIAAAIVASCYGISRALTKLGTTLFP